ncbi:MAG: hypothetical protein KatS3mg015_2609 [Fimbriimonadales bacterium]|nr:MAG: hypothetical protein KatS3mg015_2609 [Fimbriimonadales bacterium]
MNRESDRPPALSKYLEIDLDPDSTGGAAQVLFNKVDKEAEANRIVINPEHTDRVPPFLTNAMAQWYQSCIGELRDRALTHLMILFRQDTVDNVGTSLLEADIDGIRAREAKAIKSLVDEFRQKHKILAEQLQRSRTDYQKKRDEEGRDAKPIKPVQQALFLTLLAIPELLMNFTSFIKVDWLNPVLAAGACMAVALMIGFASHIHGRNLCQWEKLFSEHVDEAKRAAEKRLFWVATGGLLIALAFVGYGRYWLLADAMREAMLLGGSAFTSYLMFAGTILGNVLVYIVGALIVYLMTDPVPGFAEALRELRRQERAYERAYQRDLDRILRQKRAQAEEEIRKRMNREEKYKTHPNYDRNRQWFEELRAQDDKVAALLSMYRTRLCQTLTKQRPPDGGEPFELDFDLEEIRNGNVGPARLTCTQYCGKEIKLRYGSHTTA